MTLLLFLTTALAAEPLFLDDARIWDGSATPAFVGDVLIEGDRITAVGAELVPPEGARVLDLRGKTLLPGLIDSHVHVAAVPGSDLRGDSRETLIDHIQAGLQATLACGFTTVLDTGIPMDEIPLIKQWETEGRTMPRVLLLGIPLSPPDGYITPLVPGAPSFGTPDALRAHLDALEALGAQGMKLTMEEGFVRPLWPLHSPEMQVEIREQTQAREMRVYTHAMSNREVGLALDVGTYALVHPPEDPSRTLLKRLAEEQPYVMSTMTIHDMFMGEHEVERQAGAWVELRVPPELLATARQPELDWAVPVREQMTPRLPRFLHGSVERNLHSEQGTQRRVQAIQRSVRRMHAAGVPIVLGSDAGNWTLLPFAFQGVSSVRELELLGEAGLSPVEALIAATSRPAEMLGMADEIGRIAPGLRADLVIVNGDPLVDLSAIRDLEGVLQSGVLRSPEEWMAE
jgi:imidazolonepropionase-like amidohydrolase